MNEEQIKRIARNEARSALRPFSPVETAEQLGIRYDGIQEGIGHQFTDPVTGTTFYGDSFGETEKTLKEKRELFKAAPGMPEAGMQDTMSGERVPFYPKGKGKPTQISMEEQRRLQELRENE